MAPPPFCETLWISWRDTDSRRCLVRRQELRARGWLSRPVRREGRRALPMLAPTYRPPLVPSGPGRRRQSTTLRPPFPAGGTGGGLAHLFERTGFPIGAPLAGTPCEPSPTLKSALPVPVPSHCRQLEPRSRWPWNCWAPSSRSYPQQAAKTMGTHLPIPSPFPIVSLGHSCYTWKNFLLRHFRPRLRGRFP